MITYERVRHLFDYDPTTGNLIWKNITSNRTKVGDTVGNIFCDGRYMQTSIDGKKYVIHRLVWLWHYRSMPSGNIDHIDGNGLNNKIENLRDVSSSENMKNISRRSDNKSGVTGISWHRKAKKWVAQIQVNGRNMYLGLFDDIEDAKKERDNASIHYGFHKNHGRH